MCAAAYCVLVSLSLSLSLSLSAAVQSSPVSQQQSPTQPKVTSRQGVCEACHEPIRSAREREGEGGKGEGGRERERLVN